MDGYSLYWGDSHANIHSKHMDHLNVTLDFAREMVDFLPLAYYPYYMFPVNGFSVEDWRTPEVLDREWKMMNDFAAKYNEPGKLVIFPGYEWQGTGVSGDHNVFFLKDNPPMIKGDTLSELYAELRRQKLQAYAIPHHTAYMPGVRSKDWSTHDERISPFAECFSVHGCSESDEEWIGLRENRHMGPGTAGGTTEDGLNRGYKVGIICSNDSHDAWPAVYGMGTMACYAKALTRESLWEAFGQRRVYGVTGDRIAFDFSVEGAAMGSIIRKKGDVKIACRAMCTDALDRIELLRNNRVIHTYCHNGTWDVPNGKDRITCKIRVEVGWNASPKFPGADSGPRTWSGRIAIPDGRVVSVEKCWRSPGQRVAAPGGSSCDFGFRTEQVYQGGVHTEATVFELEGRPSDTVHLEIDSKKVTMTLAEAMAGSRIVHFIEENKQHVRQKYGIDPETLPRLDRFYYLGPKIKVHRAIPQSGLVGEFSFMDTKAPAGTNHYRVRVTQRNRQMAWSSPVWVDNQ